MNAQRNTIYVSILPNRLIQDSGIGIAYERKISDLGLFVGVTKGKYQPDGETQSYGIRLACGATYVMSDDPDYNFLLAGDINYHIYGQDYPMLPKLSFSLGFGCEIYRYKNVVLIDPLNKEVSVLFGYKF